MDISSVRHLLFCELYRISTVATLWKTSSIILVPKKTPTPSEFNHFQSVALPLIAVPGKPGAEQHRAITIKVVTTDNLRGF